MQTQKGTPKMTDRQLADLKLIIELIEYMIQSQTIQMRQNIHDAYMRLAKDVAESERIRSITDENCGDNSKAD